MTLLVAVSPSSELSTLGRNYQSPLGSIPTGSYLRLEGDCNSVVTMVDGIELLLMDVSLSSTTMSLLFRTHLKPPVASEVMILPVVETLLSWTNVISFAFTSTFREIIGREVMSSVSSGSSDLQQRPSRTCNVIFVTFDVGGMVFNLIK